MSNNKQLIVQFGIIVLVVLTINPVMDMIKSVPLLNSSEFAQPIIIGVYVLLVAVAYWLREIWKFVQKFQMVKMPSSKKGTSH